MSARVIAVNGWEVVRLSTDAIEVDVLPGKGGDILQVRFEGTPLLFETSWGLRARDAAPPEGDSAARWLAMYPGGWQTIFPNGGPESGGYGFHGDASLVPYEFEVDGDAVRMRARLESSPFEITRVVRARAGSVEVAERIRNAGDDLLHAMWSHHPAFGAPFLSSACVVEADASAFEADDARDMPAGDLRPGARSVWPRGTARDGSSVDLSRLPGGCDRFGYLSDFARGRAAVTNPELAVRAVLEWDAEVFPHAWYWLEANATRDFPWYAKAYVFAIEPATTIPGQGIEVARARGSRLMTFAPDEVRETTIVLRAENL